MRARSPSRMAPLGKVLGQDGARAARYKERGSANSSYVLSPLLSPLRVAASPARGFARSAEEHGTRWERGSGNGCHAADGFGVAPCHVLQTETGKNSRQHPKAKIGPRLVQCRVLACSRSLQLHVIVTEQYLLCTQYPLVNSRVQVPGDDCYLQVRQGCGCDQPCLAVAVVVRSLAPGSLIKFQVWRVDRGIQLTAVPVSLRLSPHQEAQSKMPMARPESPRAVHDPRHSRRLS